MKDKINNMPTAMLVDSELKNIIINTKLLEQIISNLIKENNMLEDQLGNPPSMKMK